MVKKLNPRHGSMQFWPRKRAQKLVSTVRTWVKGKEAKPLGFLGYKVGMAHVMSTEKDKRRTIDVATPVTIIECPPVKIFSVRFYKNSEVKTEVLAPKLEKELGRKIVLPKKYDKKLEVEDFDAIKILVYTSPKTTTIGKKKPDVIEIGLGGSKDDQLAWIKEHIDKEIVISDIFSNNMSIDVRGVTKGKGYQGVIKRFGVNLRSHKAEKGQRRVGARAGGWKGHAHMMYRVAQPGKMGYHNRTEYNKLLIKIDDDVSQVSREGGFNGYGVVKNTYVLVKGSVPGPSKRPLVLTTSLRPNKRISKQKIDVQKVVV